MKKSDDNPIAIKSKLFALKIIRLYKFLNHSLREGILSKQLLRSGTSIGANVREALRAQSKPDFISKLGISLKEASESEYWLELLYESDYLNKDDFDSLANDCQELIKMLTAIIKSAKS